MSVKSLLFFVLLTFSCMILTAESQGRSCPLIKPRNGRIKIRGRGRIARFVCNPGYDLVGKRIATCVRGHWNNPPPVCVAPGCSIGNVKNGFYMTTNRDAFINFYCDPGYKLIGSGSLFCDGKSWNSTMPECVAAEINPPLTCDFETDLCGWNHDDQHDFEWIRHNFATPSGHVGTGPSHDHTLGEGSDGHYMYIEASRPRKENDTARLISPVYAADLSGRCFKFWYHMFGSATGSLLVFLKPESKKLQEIPPLFRKSGDQGNKWIEGIISLPTVQESFQIVIEGVVGQSYVSDTAIDDVELSSQCPGGQNETITDTPSLPDTTILINPTHSDITTAPSTNTVPTKPSPTTPSTSTFPPTLSTTTPTTTLTTQKQTLATTAAAKSTTRIPSTTNKPSIKTTPTPTISSEMPAFTKPPSSTAVQETVSTTSTILPPRTIFPRKTTTLIPEQVQRAEKRSEDVASNKGSPLVSVVLVVGGLLLIGIVCGGAYFLHKKRKMDQAKLADDSDIRYLKDDEIQIETDSSL